jgi:hypothetical protein
MDPRDRMTGFELAGATAIVFLAAGAIVGLLGVAVFDEGSETYGKVFGVSLGVLVILSAAHFAFQGWRRVGHLLGHLSGQQGSVLETRFEPDSPAGNHPDSGPQ